MYGGGGLVWNNGSFVPAGGVSGQAVQNFGGNLDLGAGAVTQLLLDQDTTIRNQGVKARCDALGACVNAFIVQWNLVNPANLITVVYPTSFKGLE